eukprot:Nitzschia sp. Nitz4//scaffold378_size14206//2417//3976//NITZ4_008947-RA/size14206-processed-gene-0.11-mRNA-1//1//CDS//3329549687//4655//frame0
MDVNHSDSSIPEFESSDKRVLMLQHIPLDALSAFNGLSMLHLAVQTLQPSPNERPSAQKRISFARFILLFTAMVEALVIWRALSSTEIPGVIDFQLGETLALPTLSSLSSNHRILRPCAVALEEIANEFVPDYGRLHIHPVGNDSRHINASDHLTYQRERRKLLERMHRAESILQKRKFYHDDEIEDDPPDRCHRPNWKSKFHPICNNFHDIDMFGEMLQEALVFRGEATFRAAWTYNSDWVLKTIRFPWMKGLKIVLGLQKEAIVLEALSRSPRIIDMYGYCGLNTIAEFMPYEAEDGLVNRLARHEVRKLRKRENRTRSLNNLSSLDVLDTLIRLAESVADVHGYEGGVIAHGDLNPEQWLMNANGEIKLNDFNNGFIMDWSYDNQAYCGENHAFTGNFMSFEAHWGFDNATEQVDIYGFGGTIYTVMTGLYPYWQYRHHEIDERIDNGVRVPIELYFRENGTLDLQLSNLCMDTDFSLRPTIFEVIQRLKTLRRMLLDGELLGRRKNDLSLST